MQQSIKLDIEVSDEEYVAMDLDVEYDIAHYCDGEEIELLSVTAPTEYRDNAFVTNQLNNDDFTNNAIEEAIYHGL